MKPNSTHAISSYIYFLKEFMNWCFENGYIDNNNVYAMLDKLDSNKFWKKIKTSKNKKYISYETYTTMIKEIEQYEPYNPVYCETLIQCLYVGVYTKKLDVFKNLRLSDIQGNNVTSERIMEMSLQENYQIV